MLCGRTDVHYITTDPARVDCFACRRILAGLRVPEAYRPPRPPRRPWEVQQVDEGGLIVRRFRGFPDEAAAVKAAAALTIPKGHTVRAQLESAVLDDVPAARRKRTRSGAD